LASNKSEDKTYNQQKRKLIPNTMKFVSTFINAEYLMVKAANIFQRVENLHTVSLQKPLDEINQFMAEITIPTIKQLLI
jgi:hypothetical protein